MDQLTVAKILFAETKNLLPAASAPTALNDARCALATAIVAANGVGYAPPVDPSAIELADDANKSAWRDCLTAASSAPVLSVVGPICVFDDQLLTVTKSIPALKALASAGRQSTFGPFLNLKGETSYLQMFTNQDGVGPGRYPRDNSHPVTASPVSSRSLTTAAKVGHGWWLGLALLVLIAALGWVGRCAYDRGVTLSNGQLEEAVAWASPKRAAEFNVRLTTAITKGRTVPGDQNTIPAVVLAVAKELNVEAGNHAVFSAVQAKNAVDRARQAALLVILQSPDANLSDAQRKKLAADVSSVVANTVASDPLFKPVEANLLLPWVSALIFVAVVIGIVGFFIRGTCIGAMIDSRNRLSLSLLQMAGWTVLIFSLFYVTSLFLVGASPTPSPLPVYDSGIWALLGISIGSASISRIVLEIKDHPASLAGSGSVSLLDKRDDPNSWSFFDLFSGEEESNSSTVDLPRLQQVIVTIVLMIIFSGMTATILSSIGWPANWSDWAKHAIPDLTNNPSFLGLLGISHGGYLLFKGLPKQGGSPTSTAAPGSPPAK